MIEKKYWGFMIYIFAFAIFLGPIYITPFLAQSNYGLFSFLQIAYAPTCHQLAERSLCYFQNGHIGDCIIPGMTTAPKAAVVDINGVPGYKFPVCARDLGIYTALLIGAFIFAFWKKIDNTQVPELKYFIIALIPIAIDGGTQLIGLRTSTNPLRLITGFIAGFVVPFYVLPMLNALILGRESGKTNAAKTT